MVGSSNDDYVDFEDLMLVGAPPGCPRRNMVHSSFSDKWFRFTPDSNDTIKHFAPSIASPLGIVPTMLNKKTPAGAIGSIYKNWSTTEVFPNYDVDPCQNFILQNPSLLTDYEGGRRNRRARFTNVSDAISEVSQNPAGLDPMEPGG